MTLRNGDPFPFVIAVIPSFNEEESIERTIGSLRSQTRPPDEIIVLADNCTDTTVALALATGVSVWETRENADGKAGALNQLLDEILDILDTDDSVLVMDADTVLTERFVEATVKMLFTPSKKPIAGVGGIFLADDDEWSWVRQLQSNEYVRYQRRLSRRGGRALVLTGTGTVFRAGVLRLVRDARRSGILPDLGEGRSVYDLSSLTEDNELTLSVKKLGYRVVSPRECTVKTAMMPSWSSLFKQRRRWQRGALENLIAHGINPHSIPYALRQVLTYVGVFFVPFYLFTLAVALITKSGLDFFQPLWVAVAVIYIAEQTFSVRKGGWRAIGVSILVIPELIMNSLLNVVYVTSFFGMLYATDETWGRMRNLATPAKATEPGVQNLPESSSSAAHSRHSRVAHSMRRTRIIPASLHGTHYVRHAPGARLIATLITGMVFTGIALAIAIPLINLQLAWNLIAIYVLLGAVFTIGRLIPVKNF
jgi:cellulose synthase/poly-beta-1,6-N-acetylglucosamine synthase-like glycosyltransferase